MNINSERLNEEQLLLWERIRQFELDDNNDNYTFSSRLAQENGWSLEYTLYVIEEYKKFIFLVCIAEHPLTPSDQVDQAWHLHLLYTRSYWIKFCQETLNKQIHHGPTKGGKSEKDKFEDWYAKTKIFYELIFNIKCPEEILPSNEKRFSDVHFLRVNTKKNWIIKKPKLLSWNF